MHQDGFIFQVIRLDETPFHEVTTSEGTAYVVAASGAQYAVRVSRDDAPGDGYDKKQYMCTLRVDGRPVGVGKVLHKPGDCSVFKGFLRDGDLSSTTYDVFQFAEAREDSSTQAQSLSFVQGRFDFEVWECKASSHRQSSGMVAGVEKTKPPKVPSLPEGKKWFLKPSLTATTTGRAHGSGLSTTKRVRVGNAPVCKATLLYDTPTILMLRKILRPEFPPHAVILNDFPETRSQVGGCVTVERDVKPDVIDLVGPRRIKRLAPDEELVCDLTLGDDAEPRWEKRRKRAAGG